MSGRGRGGVGDGGRRGDDGPGRGDDDAHADSFAELAEGMDGLRRIEGGRPVAARTPRAGARRGDGAAGSRPPEFHRPDEDEPLLGHRSGVRARTLARLRAGRVDVVERIDLHGHDRRTAHEALARCIERAAGARGGCVLVIHGRGHRSAGGVALLRERLPEWLTEPPIARHVAAFAPARPADGGAGATYVLLR